MRKTRRNHAPAIQGQSGSSRDQGCRFTSPEFTGLLNKWYPVREIFRLHPYSKCSPGIVNSKNGFFDSTVSRHCD